MIMIYYYDVENINDSKLEFREASNNPEYGDALDEPRYLQDVYGIETNTLINNYKGFVKTSNNKCITFPNILQHHVKPFELTDKTKPGHRRILVFFLINPLNKIISTSNVAPQQINWYSEENRKNVSSNTITFNQAKQYRLELMDERKNYMFKLSDEKYEREFSLCEH